jgi:hypothetical protein
MMMQTMTQMTFREAIDVIEEFVDIFGWLATPAHGTLPDKALFAVSVLKEQADLPLKLISLEEEANNTGAVRPVLDAFELLKFERLVLFLEDISLFAPDSSQAQVLAERLLAHLHAVRQILNEAQEVE